MTVLEHLLPLLPLPPLAGALVAMRPGPVDESRLSRLAIGSVALHLLGVLVATALWWRAGRAPVHGAVLTLYADGDSSFALRASLDGLSAVFLVVGAWLTLLVTLYSRLYLHREAGYRRFFATILLFLGGYALTVSAGNLLTLFVGWEVLGIASFLLIAFYRDRYLPVKHAVKAFSVYRIGDVGLLLALWLGHHQWHADLAVAGPGGSGGALPAAAGVAPAIAALLVLAAAVKSAQLPFASWLPRAMEGPTSSSAIFYGSLSVHLGVFLLLRTEAYWGAVPAMRWVVGGIGLATALVATGIARAQASVKSQIAYASEAQIGLMFLEVALGLPALALVHFAGNACLRTYQLLVSPSVVAYLIREQFYEAPPARGRVASWLPRRLVASAYVLSFKEWNLDAMLIRALWNPLKWLGTQLDVTAPGRRPLALGATVPLLAGVLAAPRLPAGARTALSMACAAFAVSLALTAFTKRRRPRLAWALLPANHVGLVAAVHVVTPLAAPEVALYLGGILAAALGGAWCLARLEAAAGPLTLTRFHGHAERHPRLAFGFLLAALGVSAFPITPAFVGEDLLLAHVAPEQLPLAAAIAASVVLDALAGVRLYARLFLGPPVRGGRVSYRAA